MERFFFDHEYYAKYYNCSRFTSEEWYQFGKPNLPLGIIYFTLGSIYVVSLRHLRLTLLAWRTSL